MKHLMKSKKKPLTLDLLQTTVTKKYKNLIRQDIVDEVNHLVEDPDYGEEFRDSILTHIDILSGKENYSMREYTDAIKYYSLTAAGLSQADAYIRVFPERMQARLDRDQPKHKINGEASRFNQSQLVTKIRSQALVPLHLVNQGVTQQAINQLASLMMNARSDVAKVSAATALLKELRPPEVQQVELQLDTSENYKNSIADLRKATELLAIQQQQSIQAGIAVKSIAESIIVTEVEEEDSYE